MFELKNIYKSYHPSKDQEIKVLNDISLSVAQGEIFGLIGPSGAGKSTILRTFNLLETPDAGSVFFRENQLSKKATKELRQSRQKIGMIFQQFNLLSNKTVGENVALALKIAGWKKDLIAPRVKECLELVGLFERINSYPHQLSGGQKQRVAIARSIANHPYLLLADEPTSALDPITKKDILECLQEINKKLKLTIIITTHEMNVIRNICHRVAILDKGEICEVLPVENQSIKPQSSIGKMLLEIA